LTLAAANEAADEEAELLHNARQETIEGFKAREKTEEKHKVDLLNEVEHYLDDKGMRDLEDLAETAAVLGGLGARTKDVRQLIIELTREEFEMQEQMKRVETMHGYLKKELAALHEQLEELKSNPAFETPANLPALTAEWTRSTKLLNAKVGEYQDRAAALQRSRNKGPTLEDVVSEEAQVSSMLESVKSLEARIQMFHDLPKDLRGARAKYRELEAELNQVIQQRDSMLEHLVEG
jgi:HAUS augmin-like complex subunit 1